jgi:hypothetical protein
VKSTLRSTCSVVSPLVRESSTFVILTVESLANRMLRPRRLSVQQRHWGRCPMGPPCLRCDGIRMLAGSAIRPAETARVETCMRRVPTLLVCSRRTAAGEAGYLGFWLQRVNLPSLSFACWPRVVEILWETSKLSELSNCLLVPMRTRWAGSAWQCQASQSARMPCHALSSRTVEIAINYSPKIAK